MRFGTVHYTKTGQLTKILIQYYSKIGVGYSFADARDPARKMPNQGIDLPGCR